MSRNHMLSVLAVTFAAALVPVPEVRSAETDTQVLDLRSPELRSARVVPSTSQPGWQRVTFLPAEWPEVVFNAGRGKPWDWSRYGQLVLEIANPGDKPVEFGVRIDDDPSADGVKHCRTALGRIRAGDQARFSIALIKADPMSHGMRGLPGLAGDRGLTTTGQGPFDLAHIVAFRLFLHQPREPLTLEIRSARLAGETSLKLTGIVDPFGQYSHGQWPGKIQSVAEMVHRHQSEAADLKARPALPDRNRFGGWRDGPKQTATGFFRTAKVDGKWWFVDPDGALFISLGIDVVSPSESTIITGRESMFSKLPGPGDPLARNYSFVEGVHSGPVRSGKTFNFYTANLQRIYGPNYIEQWRETALARLRSWGFNTIGNWSDWRLYRNGKVPYVATAGINGSHARVSSGSDYWGKMHDPFDPRFAESVKNSLRGAVEKAKGDPWCLGYFVDNELSWGGFGDEAGRYGLALGALSQPAAGSPAKKAILKQLKQKYGEIAKLNPAWGTHLADWPALEASWKPAQPAPAWSNAFKADLAAFVTELARAYFKTVRDQLKAADPDHLYLGCRFAWRTNEAIAAANEYCDVVSFNIYERRVDPTRWDVLGTLDRPAIIGEFHVGALDRGMFHTGLVSASTQEERAAIYAGYVTSVLDNPALVGCHWFQYVDEPLTGRSYDGENYNIGFVNVTDIPYPELVTAARAIHRDAYPRRFGMKSAR